MAKLNPSLKFSGFGFLLPFFTGICVAIYNSLFGFNAHGYIAPLLFLLVPIVSIATLLYGFSLSLKEPLDLYRVRRQISRRVCTILLLTMLVLVFVLLFSMV